MSHIKDPSLRASGKRHIEWAAKRMPVLAEMQSRFKKEKPLKGINIACCLHITSETANLALTLKEAGAMVGLCASNPLSTQDHVAAALASLGIDTFAIKGEDSKTYYEHLHAVLDTKPQITMDDGGDLITLLHTKRTKDLTNVIGSSEETTTGVIRLKAMEKEHILKIPVIAVNDSQTKHFFDNRYGTGQSTIDGILRATNILLAGKTFVVAGYGWCGKGVAKRAAGMGALVVVTETDPVRALEAAMDGYRVMRMEDAAMVGDIFVTVTGNKNVVTIRHMERMRDGAVLANAGHFDVEVDVSGLEKVKRQKREIRPSLTEYTLANGRVYLIGEGRLVNLAAAEGHPPEVMDMSFANQTLAAEYLVKCNGQLKPGVYALPRELDMTVARLKLDAMGITIDALTKEQQSYLASWTEGTK